MRSPALPVITASQARTLLLEGQGLLAPPERRADRRALLRCIEGLGFAQIDTINVVARAHDLTLHSRLDAYRPASLAKLLEQDRALFEHWTHDASIIPSEFYPMWQTRFRQFRTSPRAKMWAQRRLGPQATRFLRRVRARIEHEGPLMSRDFESEARKRPNEGKSGWGSSKRASFALVHLWRRGELAIAGRQDFHKRYDLPERTYPEAHTRPAPTSAQHLDWHCRSALERLGAATASELAAFWNAIPIRDAQRWCQRAARRGEAVEVMIEAADGSATRQGVARTDFASRIAGAEAAPDRARLLSPFDPLIRDRARTARLFDFDYRFEGFVPRSKRRDGVYVMPVLDGDRLVARLDPKYHRERGVLEIRSLRWESRPNRAARRRLQEAIERLATFIGAPRIDGIR